MVAEIVTTHFIAHSDDLGEAYGVWRDRVVRSGAEVLALSPAPHPVDDEFILWDLRTEAAYGNLRDPESMALYELNALVDFAGLDRDERIETFFMDDPFVTPRFPSTLGGLTDLALRDSVGPDPLRLVTVAYLGTEAAIPHVHSLFDALLARSHVVAYQPELALLEGTEHASLVGPLWVRDATLNLIGTGDRVFSPGKEAWAGWFLTADPLEDVEARLPEIIEPGTVVIGRAVAEAF
ncbi:hypothetical protein [Corynebacterium liangguodongii]|uniref:Uncharacterized protein n=1 Tax=Corynebacterium liangguodongii TaxID=2079535 RepID=A0A2S0WGN4_9CORY|nr:hypothetical protein [Corynebacterium liangguodongii]AWB84937.1 hypothetical protein C3E79_11035 [Corynebacterium liangguodongii]PWB99355.1 hypothetical protein DF219_07240 [Corynebacterium liangguodongii]